VTKLFGPVELLEYQSQFQLLNSLAVNEVKKGNTFEAEKIEYKKLTQRIVVIVYCRIGVHPGQQEEQAKGKDFILDSR
jgi:hypothetical protein